MRPRKLRVVGGAILLACAGAVGLAWAGWRLSTSRTHQLFGDLVTRVETADSLVVIQHAAKIRSPHSAVILFQLGGALNRLEPGHSPAGNRDARYVLNVAGAWEGADDDEANMEWARAAWSDMRSFSTGGTYVNFLTADDGPERTQAALGSGVKRLAEIKTRWDPRNVFRTNRNIAPA